MPYTDYIVGCPDSVLRNEGDFYDLVESVRLVHILSQCGERDNAQHVDKPLRLFVWNYDFDVLRQVVLVPNRSWGSGEGLIGCGIGFGLLHRCVARQPRSCASVAETAQDTETARPARRLRGERPARGRRL